MSGECLGFTSGLPAVYAEMAERRPSDDALVFVSASGEERRYSWAQSLARAGELAAWLRDEGVGRGGRIAVELEGSIDLIPALVAVWALGAVVVPVDSLWGPWLRDGILAHACVDAVMSLAGTPRLGGPPPRLGNAPVSLPHDCAMLSYTSGTSSSPRGVILRHSHLLAAYRQAASAIRATLGANPRTVGCAMRISGLGIFGMHHLWAATMGARTVSFPELSAHNVAGYWERLVAYDVQLTYLVPALVALVNFANPETPPGRVLPTVLSGGAPLPPLSQERFQRSFGARLLNVYGLTEVSFAAFFGHLGEAGWGTPSIGKPVTVNARLRRSDGTLVDAAGVGELELAGEVLSDGYYADDRGTATAIVDGWLRTGDIARVDPSGAYEIIGRNKDVVLKGAFTVHLSEAEAAALSLPGVIDAGALRLRSQGGGEDLGLVIQVSPGEAPDPRRVRRSLEERLGRQRSPRQVLAITHELPKVGHGKLDRSALAAIWSESVGGGEARSGAGDLFDAQRAAVPSDGGARDAR